MKFNFLIQIDANEMEYGSAFETQEFADALLATAAKMILNGVAKGKQGTVDAEIIYLGSAPSDMTPDPIE